MGLDLSPDFGDTRISTVRIGANEVKKYNKTHSNAVNTDTEMQQYNMQSHNKWHMIYWLVSII